MIYKVSYVIRGGGHPGAILDTDEMPQVGQVVTLGGADFEIVETEKLLPERAGFGFLHVTCVPADQGQ